jgi:hypothetical protein
MQKMFLFSFATGPEASSAIVEKGKHNSQLLEGWSYNNNNNNNVIHFIVSPSF